MCAIGSVSETMRATLWSAGSWGETGSPVAVSRQVARASQAGKASSPQSISSLGQTPIALWEVRRPSTPTIVVPHRAGRDGGLNPSLDVPDGVTLSWLGPVRHHEFVAYIPQMRTHRAARALS